MVNRDLLPNEDAQILATTMEHQEKVELEGVTVFIGKIEIGKKEQRRCILIIPCAGNSILLSPDD
ncbi:hypothetical protein GCM10023174_09940 [Chelativorans composti]|uniref:Uncharacterized protein n=1 Tax=Chelativorans composti TaxID=768533 RepID=A0ABW5DJI5_9HYPH